MTNDFFLFGHPIAIKRWGCNHEDRPGGRIPPAVNIFVKITNGCNANCAFCSNANTPATHGFDMDKLFRVVDEAVGAGLMVNRINITGGEPSSVPARVETLLARMEDKKYQQLHLHLNTNGLLPASQDIMKYKRWDSISVSLHHYDRKKLSEIYQTDIAESALQFEGVDRSKLNASCNLIKGYVDSTTEAQRMMDCCLDLGLHRLGFVGLMPVNEFCRTHLIPLSQLHLEEISHCYFTEARNRGADCQCCNYLYNRQLKVLEIYMRHYVNPQYCESSLLYDGEFLRQGFFQNNIIY